MWEFVVGLVIGILFSLYYRYTLSRRSDDLKLKSYFEGWTDRHRGKPLLPRYWVNFRLGDYNDPLDQRLIRGLDSEESYESRLRNGLPPYDLDDPTTTYALSDRELQLLENPEERIWRGITNKEIEALWDDAELQAEVRAEFSRFPDCPEKDDLAVLQILFETYDIEQYYRISDLVIIRDRKGRISKIKWNR
jgi:hypothetical protein